MLPAYRPGGEIRARRDACLSAHKTYNGGSPQAVVVVCHHVKKRSGGPPMLVLMDTPDPTRIVVTGAPLAGSIELTSKRRRL